MATQTLTKVDIAEQQLFHALELYMHGTDLVSAITLAGAAEEILGKIARAAGHEAALDQKLRELCDMFRFAFPDEGEPDPKEFQRLRNRARNELKHYNAKDELKLDLEKEAAQMLKRAIQNYRHFKPLLRSEFRAFEKEYLKRAREEMRIHA